jgi:TrkA domain protein
MAVGRIRLGSASDLVGKSLAESGLRTRTGALVLTISRGSDNIGSPDPQFELAAGDVLVVVGQPHQLEAARALAADDYIGPGVAAPRHPNS